MDRLAAKELPPDPKLEGWPKPIGVSLAIAEELVQRMFGRKSEYIPVWSRIGINCYHRRKLRSS